MFNTPHGLQQPPFDLQKLEDCDRKAVHQIDQLQREQRHLKRRLEKLGAERTRMDSVGSVVSSERSDSDRGEPHLPEGRQATEPAPEQIRQDSPGLSRWLCGYTDLPLCLSLNPGLMVGGENRLPKAVL